MLRTSNLSFREHEVLTGRRFLTAPYDLATSGRGAATASVQPEYVLQLGLTVDYT